MDATTWTQLISSLGFPIIVCGALAWYIVKRDRDYSDERTNELEAVKEAINNNTVVMQQLIDKFDAQ